MARGNRIVVNANPKGARIEGILTEALKPGTIVQIDPSVALAHGRHTYVAYNRDADGDQPKGGFWVIEEDLKLGALATTAYAIGDQVPLYAPQPGDELNLLFGNASGTADDIALGTIMMVDDGTGKVVATTGSPETEVAVALEAIVDPTADQLLWCQWSGH